MVGRSGSAIRQTTNARTSSTVAARAIPVVVPALVDLGLVDRGWYVAEAQALVDRVLGTHQGAKQMSLLDDA